MYSNGISCFHMELTAVSYKQMLTRDMYCICKFATIHDSKLSKSSIFQIMDLHGFTSCEEVALLFCFCLTKRHVHTYAPMGKSAQRSK